MVEYLGLDRLGKRLWLFDTFSGHPMEQLTERELAGISPKVQAAGYDKQANLYESVRETFAPYPNVEIVRGIVPESLSMLQGRPIAFLHMDTNGTHSDSETLAILWENLVVGAHVVVGRYAHRMYPELKKAVDEVAARHGHTLLQLPTGQGLLVKTR